MIKHLCRLLWMLVFTGWVSTTSAALMAPVLVNGNEWLQPLDFRDFSWNDMAAVCNRGTGLCNGVLGDNDITGWTWASYRDLDRLMNFFAGYDLMGFSSDCYSCVQAFYEAGFAFFEVDVPPGYRPVRSIVGTLREQYGDTLAHGGFVYDRYTQGEGSLGTREPFSKSKALGGWFYQPAPSPATIPLIAIALAGLGWSRRKQ